MSRVMGRKLKVTLTKEMKKFFDTHETRSGTVDPESDVVNICCKGPDWFIYRRDYLYGLVLFRERSADREFTAFLKEFYPEVFL